MLRKFGPKFSLARKLGVAERSLVFQISRLSTSSTNESRQKSSKPDGLASGFLRAFNLGKEKGEQESSEQRNKGGAKAALNAFLGVSKEVGERKQEKFKMARTKHREVKDVEKNITSKTFLDVSGYDRPPPIKPATTSKRLFESMESKSEDIKIKKPQGEQKSSKQSLFSELLLSSLGKEKPSTPDSTDINRMKMLLSSLNVESNVKDDIEDRIIQASKEMMSYRATGKMNMNFEDNETREAPSTPFTDLFTGPRLDIFDLEIMKKSVAPQEIFISVQEKEQAKNLQELCEITGPNNGFEEMMKNADKMWQFPVDNEVIKVEEKDVGFEDHVFLEEYLDQFPDVEPVRRFMELVITGLQKNPYITANEKKQHILWFKDYFEQFPSEDLDFS